MSLDIKTRSLDLTSKHVAAKPLLNQTFSVFEARPADTTKIRGAVIVVQEIFGVNHHIRKVAEERAKEGYIAWAPAYFDHVEKGVELKYDSAGMAKGREIVTQIGWDQAVEDTRVAAVALRETLTSFQAPEKVIVEGFCWGGSVAWFAAARFPKDLLQASVSYYGSAVLQNPNEPLHTPIILHFGEKDAHISANDVRAFKEKHPKLPVYLYDADHGFNCDERSAYNADAAKLAHQRTVDFLKGNGIG